MICKTVYNTPELIINQHMTQYSMLINIYLLNSTKSNNLLIIVLLTFKNGLYLVWKDK